MPFQDEYSIVYENELCTNYAFEKLNKFKTSSSRYDSIVLEKTINIRQELINKLNEKTGKSENLSYEEYFLSQLVKKPTISDQPSEKVPISNEKVN